MFLQNVYRFSYIATPLLTIYLSLIPNHKPYLLADFDRLDQKRDIHSSFQEKNESALPAGPLELMNALQRASAMDDATSPSDALDEALKNFSTKDQDNSILPPK